MSRNINLCHAHSFEQWAGWFKNELAPSDLDNDGVLAYLRYFADLEILEPIADENKWRLSGVDVDSNPDGIHKIVLDRLEAVSRTSAGFAVNFFLGRQPDISLPEKETESSASKITPKVKSNSPNLDKSSDLSNLQIVKKVGRQLQPFLEFEKKTVARLLGAHTQKKEARVIFNFILRHTRTEAEPKQWEQLSRKRHK
jgi:hypothetical protein